MPEEMFPAAGFAQLVGRPLKVPQRGATLWLMWVRILATALDGKKKILAAPSESKHGKMYSIWDVERKAKKCDIFFQSRNKMADWKSINLIQQDRGAQ